MSPNGQIWRQRGLIASAGVLGCALVWLTLRIFTPLFAAASFEESKGGVRLPENAVEPWYALPVQEKRTKPFQTACVEAVRQITGRSRFEGLDPVGVVLDWMLRDPSAGPTDWETYPFLLCDHHGLRAVIFEDQADKRIGKHVSPAELRGSPGFDRLLQTVARKRKELQGRAHLELDTEHLKAEEVSRRLALFDALCGRPVTRLHLNAIAGDQFIDLSDYADIEGVSVGEAAARLEDRLPRFDDPLHLVGLDRAPGSLWFSLTEVRAIVRDPQRWQTILSKRIFDSPERYAALAKENDDGIARTEVAGIPVPPAPLAAAERVLKRFDDLRAAYRAGNAEAFDRASGDFFTVLRETTDWSVATTLDLELLYNRTHPFLWAWIIMLLAVALLITSLMNQSRAAYAAGLALFAGSLVVQVFGFVLRIAISGRAPVSNMYETVIFVAFMSALFALVLEVIYRRTVIGLAGAGVATLGLVLADQLPLALDPRISPMVPVLRTNYWLTVHVLTIVSAYAGGTLAWGLGNLTLMLLVFRKGTEEGLRTLAHYTYRAMQIAVLLLAAGTFLGGWWASESWGRFWGWDPKETAALIALVCYVVPLHARYLGWVRDFGLAVSAVLCYASILLSWYVVNFVVAAGLHSYGFSTGGGSWVLWASLVNIEWVLIAAIVHGARRTA